MKIYYFYRDNKEDKNDTVGSRNKRKIEYFADRRPVYECDITEFNGQLLSNEFNY